MAVIRIDVKGGHAETSLRRLRKEFGSTQVAIDRTTKSNGLFSSSTARLVGALAGVYGGLISIRGAFNLGSGFVKTSAQFEQYEATLRSITGSSVKAKESMKWVEDFASSTPFNIDKVTEAFVKMKAYGLDPTDGTLKALGNTASAMGKDINQAVEAMADAVTGENERLKEFGIKASKLGDTIAYNWADSSGKSRNIVIQNNKEMIQSTLNAILNEKYVGAMDAQAKTWNGMVSNLQDTWTLFKKDVMNEGLFSYLKSILAVSGDWLKSMFGSAKEGAKEFSISTINGIESVIKGVGVLKDTWTLFSSVFGVIKTAFWQLVAVFGTGMNAIQSSWHKLGNTMSTMWADMANGVQKIFETMINWIIAKVNGVSGIVNVASNALDLGDVLGKLDEVKFTRIKADINTNIIDPIANTETALKYAEDARAEYEQGFKNFSVGQGQKDALKLIEDIKKKQIEITKEDVKSNSEKEKAKKILDDLIKKQKNLSLAATNNGKAQTKAIKDAQKEAKKLQDQLDVTAQSFADIFNQGFESILKGDFAGGLADIFGNAMQKSTSNLSSAFSGGLSNLFTGAGSFTDAFKSLGSLDFLGSAVSLLGGLFSTTISESEIKAAAGRTEFDSKGTIDIVTTLDKYQQPQLTATKSMLEHLKSMDANLLNALSAANVGGLDLAGSTYTPQTSSVLGGVLFASSTELIGSGIKFYDQAVSSFTQGVEADGYEAIKKSSSFLGIFTSESISENLKDLPSGVKKQIGDAFNEGLQGALDGLEILGFDTASIESKLNDYVVSLGKINFQDLNLEEQAKALNQALTSELNNALNTSLSAVANPQNYNALLSMAQAGEETVATIARVAVGYETAQTQLAMFGQSVTTFTQSQALIDAAGGLDSFTSKMDSFLQNFFTSEERDAMMKQQLQYALAVYDVALPASKEQYKALVLETQAKILAVQAQIDARKAEIRTMIESGKFQEQYVNNYAATQEYLGNVLGKSGQEVVAYGNNVRRSIEAMTTGQQEAITFDAELGTFSVDWNAFGDGILSSLEAEKSSLSGLYDTLLSSGDAFATVADNATSALNDLEQSLVAIANLKAVWGSDDISAKKIILDATRRETGLTNLTYDNFLSEFESITANGLGIDKDTLQAYQDMSSALRALHDVEVQKVEKDISFYNGIISNIRTLQDMSLTQEEIYARNLNEINNGTDNASVIKSVMEQANLLKDTSNTQDEYNFELRKLENTLADLKPEEDATTQDVVDSLKKLREELDDIKSEIAQGNRIALEQTA